MGQTHALAAWTGVLASTKKTAAASADQGLPGELVTPLDSLTQIKLGAQQLLLGRFTGCGFSALKTP